MIHSNYRGCQVISENAKGSGDYPLSGIWESRQKLINESIKFSINHSVYSSLSPTNKYDSQDVNNLQDWSGRVSAYLWIFFTVISSHSSLVGIANQLIQNFKKISDILNRIEIRKNEDQSRDRTKCCFLNFLIKLTSCAGALSLMKINLVVSKLHRFQRFQDELREVMHWPMAEWESWWRCESPLFLVFSSLTW